MSMLEYLDRKIGLGTLFWASPAVFLVHDLEEILTMERFWRENRDRLPIPGALEDRIEATTQQMAAAVACVLATGYLSSYVAASSPGRVAHAHDHLERPPGAVRLGVAHVARHATDLAAADPVAQFLEQGLEAQVGEGRRLQAGTGPEGAGLLPRPGHESRPLEEVAVLDHLRAAVPAHPRVVPRQQVLVVLLNRCHRFPDRSCHPSYRAGPAAGSVTQNPSKPGSPSAGRFT